MSAARDANSGIPLQFARPRGAAPPRRAQANAPPAGSPAPRHRLAAGPTPPRDGPPRAGATTGAPASGPLPQTRPKRRRPGRADQAPAPPTPGSLPRRRSAGLGSPGNATRRAAAGRRYTDIRGSCRPARNSADPCVGRTDRKPRSPTAKPAQRKAGEIAKLRSGPAAPRVEIETGTPRLTDHQVGEMVAVWRARYADYDDE